MKKIGKLLIVASSALILGCATGDHLYSENGQCITCWNNPLTGEPINHSNKDKASTSTLSEDVKAVKTKQPENSVNKYCGKKVKYDKNVPIDVDLAYIKYKRIFGYKTKDEKIRARGLDPATASPLYTIMDSGFRHRVVPNVRYLMKDSVRMDNGKESGWLSIELEKSSDKSALVFVEYCEGGSEGFDPKYTKVILEKIESAYL